MQIVTVGHVCIDRNISENAEYTAAGGPPIFMTKVFSQISDVSVVNVAPYGKDFLGFANSLPLYPSHPMQGTTLIYENITKGNVRKQKAYNIELAEPIPVDIQLKKLLVLADIIVVAPIVPNFSPEYVQSIFGVANKNALKILLPQGYYRNFTKNNDVALRSFKEEQLVLPFFDMVIVSEQDGEDMFNAAKNWSTRYSLTSIVTLGDKGAVAIEKGTKISLPTIPLDSEKVIDSTGSGEIFAAALAYEYKKTANIKRAGTFANAIARACLFYPSDEIQIDPTLLSNF